MSFDCTLHGRFDALLTKLHYILVHAFTYLYIVSAFNRRRGTCSIHTGNRLHHAVGLSSKTTHGNRKDLCFFRVVIPAF